ncbi:ABC transporter permease [Candidatus Saganbacteria bacterium]|nr:ABC transporter permease [Candidatus Saganbacteria bacterium]
MVELRAIYVLWLRDLIKFSRARERQIGSLAMPIMFLLFLGFGFSGANLPGIAHKVDYVKYLVPGIIGMNMLFGSMFSGISVLWDKEFGFLKEIMVAPVSRISIALGRIAGGATTSLVQGLLLFVISFFLGFSFVPAFSPLRIVLGVVLMVVFMALISLTFIALGLSFASNMRDAEGFELIINFVMFPLFFLSGAIAPITTLPPLVRILSYLNPLTYAVDGLRAALLGLSMFPLLFDLVLAVVFAVFMVSLAAFFFERSESV